MKLNIRYSGLRKILVAGTASVGLLLSACDSALLIDPNAVDNMGVVDPTNPTDPTDPTDPNAAVNLIATAEANGSFATLLSAIDSAGLRDTLADENSTFTVFAPTDAAFEALGDGAVTALVADTTLLNDTLLYHVLNGASDSTAITALAGGTVTMLNGKNAAISQEGDALRINTSTIVTADVAASNGVIHVIDAVLTPPQTAPTPTENVAAIVASDPEFTTLVTALEAASLDSVLAGDGNFTVFAPNNAAFDTLGAETLNALIADPDALRDVLLYHVVQDATLTSTDAIAAAGTSLTSAAEGGPPLAVTLVDDQLRINGAAVTRADIQASNGIVHEIDTVLQQPAAPVADSVFDKLNADPNFSSLVSAIQTAGLDATLKDMSKEYTVFAPNNAAFTAADAAIAAGFSADPAALAQVLLGHVINSKVTAADAAAAVGTDVTMANEAVRSITEDAGALLIDGATILATDIAASNGIIHEIDMVLLPTN